MSKCLKFRKLYQVPCRTELLHRLRRVGARSNTEESRLPEAYFGPILYARCPPPQTAQVPAGQSHARHPVPILCVNRTLITYFKI